MEIFDIQLRHQFHNLHALNLKQVVLFSADVKHVDQFIQ